MCLCEGAVEAGVREFDSLLRHLSNRRGVTLHLILHLEILILLLQVQNCLLRFIAIYCDLKHNMGGWSAGHWGTRPGAP